MTLNAQPAEPEVSYPIGEKRPEQIRTRSGRQLADLTLEHLLAGEVTASDFGITAEGLRQQARIAEQAGRPNLAHNLRRGAELVAIPDEVLLDLYELLRPGRATSAGDLRAAAERLRHTYGAEATARLIDEAATVYERRDFFQRRY